MGADVEMGTGNGSTMLPDLFEHDEEQEKMESIKEQLAALQVLSPPMAEWPRPRDMVPPVPCHVALVERSNVQVGSACAFVRSLRQLRGTCACTGINLCTIMVAYKQAQLAKNHKDLDSGRAHGFL